MNKRLGLLASTFRDVINPAVPGDGQASAGGARAVGRLVLTGRHLTLVTCEALGLNLAQLRAHLHQVYRYRRTSQWCF